MKHDSTKQQKQIQTRICANLRSKAKKLELEIPSTIWILPQNFEQLKPLEDFYYESDYDLIAKLFRTNNIQFSLIDKNETSYSKISQHSFEFVTLPLVVFLIDVIHEHPEIIRNSLSILSEFFKKRIERIPNKEEYIIKSKVVKEVKNSTFKEYSYEGPVDKYDDFIKFVKEDKND